MGWPLESRMRSRTQRACSGEAAPLTCTSAALNSVTRTCSTPLVISWGGVDIETKGRPTEREMRALCACTSEMSWREMGRPMYCARAAFTAALFEGVVQSLDAFRAQGYHLAVATGKARRGLDRVLKAHGWEDYFDITRAADETASKPHPLMLEQIMAHCGVSSRQALMVGDASFDLMMARNAGMDSVAVSYGAQSAEALQQYEPRVTIDHFSELQAWLGRAL